MCVIAARRESDEAGGRKERVLGWDCRVGVGVGVLAPRAASRQELGCPQGHLQLRPPGTAGDLAKVKAIHLQDIQFPHRHCGLPAFTLPTSSSHTATWKV